ncbi:hypothetical protein GCM10010300_40410 [Streptomyces olivaceoviridis]|nr:hypothetical protein GCM10010300_40410 [Streptomyces olivaceoviridis]
MAAERALRALAVRCHLDRHVLPYDSHDRAVGTPRGGPTGERAAAGPFSAVVSDCRPWPGRRWGAGHLGEDARPDGDAQVTRCTELVRTDRDVTVCDRASGLESSPLRSVLTEERKGGLTGAVRCYGAAYMQDHVDRGVGLPGSWVGVVTQGRGGW